MLSITKGLIVTGFAKRQQLFENISASQWIELILFEPIQNNDHSGNMIVRGCGLGFLTKPGTSSWTCSDEATWSEASGGRSAAGKFYLRTSGCLEHPKGESQATYIKQMQSELACTYNHVSS